MANHVMTFEQYCTKNTEIVDEGLGDRFMDMVNDTKKVAKKLEENLEGYIANALKYNGLKGVGVAGATEDDYLEAVELAKNNNWRAKTISDPKLKQCFDYLWNAATKSSQFTSPGSHVFGGGD